MAKLVAIIGRESGNRRLEIRVGGNVGYMGSSNTVPQNVSRKHCQLIFDTDNNTCIIKNISDDNISYVNGQEVASKTCKLTDKLQLGPSKFQVPPLDKIYEIAKKLAGTQPPPPPPPPPSGSFSISHLEYVWDRYEKDLKKIKEEYRKNNLIINALRMSPFILGSALSLVWKGSIFIGAIVTLFAFILIAKQKPIDEEIKKLNDDLIDHYKCPNPECGHFMGYQNFKIVKQNKQCPHCHCKYHIDNKRADQT